MFPETILGVTLWLGAWASLLCGFAGFGQMVTAIGRIRLAAPLRERLIEAAAALDRDNATSLAYSATSRALRVGWAALAVFTGIFMQGTQGRALFLAVFVGGLVMNCFAIVIAVTRSNAASKWHVAVIEVRRPSSAVSPFAVAVALIAALAPLSIANVPSVGWLVAVASFGSVVLLYVGLHLAAMPARLLGDDIPAERFVDNRFRIARARGIIALAPVLSVVILEVSRTDTPMGVAATMVAAIAMFAGPVWNLHSLYGKPNESELRELQSAPAEMSA